MQMMYMMYVIVALLARGSHLPWLVSIASDAGASANVTCYWRSLLLYRRRHGDFSMQKARVTFAYLQLSFIWILPLDRRFAFWGQIMWPLGRVSVHDHGRQAHPTEIGGRATVIQITRHAFEARSTISCKPRQQETYSFDDARGSTWSWPATYANNSFYQRCTT
jgi:hypothetical protein